MNNHRKVVFLLARSEGLKKSKRPYCNRRGIDGADGALWFKKKNGPARYYEWSEWETHSIQSRSAKFERQH